MNILKKEINFFFLNLRSNYRCYNCGQFSNHLAAECTLEKQPKKCHYCKSSEHLMANCTQSKVWKRLRFFFIFVVVVEKKYGNLFSG